MPGCTCPPRPPPRARIDVAAPAPAPSPRRIQIFPTACPPVTPLAHIDHTMNRPHLLVTLAAAFLAVLSAVAPSAAVAGAPVPAAAVARAASAPSANLYRIGPGDTLRITVYQSPDLSLETRVTEAGVISFPLIGRVEVGGLTVNQAETRIADALKQGDFVKNPMVMIVVTVVRANQVNVLGQVAHPGRFPLDVTGMKLTEVLAMAGGIVAGVGSDTVVIIGERDGKPFRHAIDLPTLFQPGGTVTDPVVGPGDTVWVDRAPQIYVYGEVQHPGVIRLERGMTVMQALAASGGVTARGTVRGLKITRHDAAGHVRTFEPGMEDTLQDGDVMFIRESLF